VVKMNRFFYSFRVKQIERVVLTNRGKGSAYVCVLESRCH